MKKFIIVYASIILCNGSSFAEDKDDARMLERFAQISSNVELEDDPVVYSSLVANVIHEYLRDKGLLEKGPYEIENAVKNIVPADIYKNLLEVATEGLEQGDARLYAKIMGRCLRKASSSDDMAPFLFTDDYKLQGQVLIGLVYMGKPGTIRLLYNRYISERLSYQTKYFILECFFYCEPELFEVVGKDYMLSDEGNLQVKAKLVKLSGSRLPEVVYETILKNAGGFNGNTNPLESRLFRNIYEYIYENWETVDNKEFFLEVSDQAARSDDQMIFLYSALIAYEYGSEEMRISLEKFYKLSGTEAQKTLLRSLKAKNGQTEDEGQP